MRSSTEVIHTQRRAAYDDQPPETTGYRPRAENGAVTIEPLVGQPPDRLTMSEAASYMGVAVKTLRDWRYRGIGVPSRKEGRRVMYERTDVERWMRLRP